MGCLNSGMTGDDLGIRLRTYIYRCMHDLDIVLSSLISYFFCFLGHYEIGWSGFARFKYRIIQYILIM